MLTARRIWQSAGANAAPTSGDGQWIASAVLSLDRSLQRRQGVFEYSTDPWCVFRIQIDVADRNLVLTDKTVVCMGDRILTLHLWNEHIPRLAPVGPTIGWGCRFGHRLKYSLKLLSQYISTDPELSGVVAIRGDLIVIKKRNAAQRIMRRCGFHTGT